jgi:hypothetical protein
MDEVRVYKQIWTLKACKMYVYLCLVRRKVFYDWIFLQSHFSFFWLFFRLPTYIARAIFLQSPENEKKSNCNIDKVFFLFLWVTCLGYTRSNFRDLKEYLGLLLNIIQQVVHFWFFKNIFEVDSEEKCGYFGIQVWLMPGN